MTHGRGSQSDEWEAGRACGVLCGRVVSFPRLYADDEQEGRSEQDQGDMTIPAEVAADFIVIQSEVFGRFQVLFDVPPCANGLDNNGQRGVRWRRDQEVSQLVGVVQAAAHHEE